MFEEKTNLYSVVAQTLQWIHGLTSIEYEISGSRLAEITQEDSTHYSFEIKTNHALLSGIRHPLGLVVEKVHVVITGIIVEIPQNLQFDNKIAKIEIEDMTQMFLLADNGGYSTVGVQTKLNLFGSGEEVLARYFLYRNNLLHLIR